MIQREFIALLREEKGVFQITLPKVLTRGPNGKSVFKKGDALRVIVQKNDGEPANLVPKPPTVTGGETRAHIYAPAPAV